MFKIFHHYNNIDANAKYQRKVDKLTSSEPKMSVEKWYELQHKLRLQQMAQARAAK